jgi:flagellar hook-basal body complex protein FliE
MNDIDVNRVLSQIRALSEQAANRPAQAAVKTSTDSGFGQVISSAVSSVNDSQQNATQLQKAFEMGDPSADLARVMIAQAGAQVSFKAMAEVRNRLVSAYQDIMNMPI